MHFLEFRVVWTSFVFWSFLLEIVKFSWCKPFETSSNCISLRFESFGVVFLFWTFEIEFEQFVWPNHSRHRLIAFCSVSSRLDEFCVLDVWTRISEIRLGKRFEASSKCISLSFESFGRVLFSGHFYSKSWNSLGANHSRHRLIAFPCVSSRLESFFCSGRLKSN